MDYNNEIKKLKAIGIKFDEVNVRECLRINARRNSIKECIEIAKELGLDLGKDATKSSVAMIAINYSKIAGCHKEAMLDVNNRQCSLTINAMKDNDIFVEILYALGEAVDRTR